MSPQELLAVYTQRNLRLLYWQRNGCDPKEWKGPHHKGWNDPDRLYPLEQYDPQTMNLGTFTGHELASGKYLADFDPDWADGLVLVKKLLPETHFCFRRKGKLLSHAFYTTPDRLGSEKYCDIPESGGDGDGITFAELRGGNWSHQTMIAPSLHSPGICVELAESGDIAHVARHILQRAVLDYAIGCLLLKHLPGGLHHDGRLALAGFLLTRELTGERVQRLMEAICDAQMRALIPDMSAKDVTDCALVVQKTRQRLSENRKVKGGPKFAEFCGARGADIVARMRKWLEVADPAVILNPNDPLPSARAFVHARYTEDDVLTLRRQTGVFYHYRSDVAAYRECDDATVRAALYTFLESAKTRGEEDDDGSLWLPFRPTKFKVSNVMDALSAVTNLDAAMAAPCWLANDPGLNPLDMLACPNGLLHIPTRTLVPATPHFFTLNGLDFRFDPHAPTPTQWLSFLEQLWPGDAESVAALQEFFGYVLTPDTRFQKIFLIVGPKRSGKGVMGRVLRRLVGERNMCSPTLASFGAPFGKQGLIGKMLAIISDARIGGRVDTASVAEALLAISGQDNQTVPRKFLPDWNGMLPVRFLLLANELPCIGDVSGALASRFVILVLKKSFFGKEDLGLSDRLMTELPGILNWALEGRDRLYARGWFVQPQSAQELVAELVDLSSPEGAMLRECTEMKPGAYVEQSLLFEAWKAWCALNGRDNPGTTQTFARNVRAVLPWIVARKHGPRGSQVLCWEGLRLVGLPAQVEQPELPSDL